MCALATAVAEAQLDLIRIRRLRHELLLRTLREPAYAAASLTPNPTSIEFPSMRTCKLSDEVPQGLERPARISSMTLQTLVKIERYERRALSRRKFVRDFDAARAMICRLGSPPLPCSMSMLSIGITFIFCGEIGHHPPRVAAKLVSTGNHRGVEKKPVNLQQADEISRSQN